MKAVVLKSPKILEILDVPIFKLKTGEVQIKIMACGICGSDIRYFSGENPWAIHTLGKQIDNPPNIILGHEFCGIVCEVKDKSNNYLLGKRVAIIPYKPCGTCEECYQGFYHLCKNTIHIGHAAGWGKQQYYPGGMAEYCPVWNENCYLLPDTISDSEATMLDIAGVAIHALNVGNVKPGQSILVLGCGPLGYCILAFSKLWGSILSITTEPIKRAREVASSQGILSFSGYEKDLYKLIISKTGGSGIDVVFDTVGNSKTQALGRKVLKSKGRIINLAIHNKRFSFYMNELSGEKILCTSCNYLFNEFKLAIDLVSNKKVKLSNFISHEQPLENANYAFNMVSNRDDFEALKVVLKP